MDEALFWTLCRCWTWVCKNLNELNLHVDNIYIYSSPLVTQRWQYCWCFRNLAGCTSWRELFLPSLQIKESFYLLNQPGFSKASSTHTINGTGIFTYIWLTFLVNLGKYTIYGSYGIDFLVHSCIKTNESNKWLVEQRKKKYSYFPLDWLLKRILIMVYDNPHIWVGFHPQGLFFIAQLMRLVGSRWLSMPKMMRKAWPQVMAIPLPGYQRMIHWRHLRVVLQRHIILTCLPVLNYHVLSLYRWKVRSPNKKTWYFQLCGCIVFVEGSSTQTWWSNTKPHLFV